MTVTNPDGCTDIVELTLMVMPSPVIDLTTNNEVCLGDNNGSVSIYVPDGLNYSLDSLTWTTDTIFNDLNPGNYTVFVEGTNGCFSNQDFTLDPGLELNIDPFSVVCNDNGTPSDATDDFYTISFNVGNNLATAGTYTINDGTIDIGTYNYDEANSFDVPASGQSLTLTFY